MSGFLDAMSKLDRWDRVLSRMLPPIEPAPEDSRADIARWLADPVAFCSEALGFDPSPDQADILRALTTDHRVNVRSGQKTGKTRVNAAAALWWPITHAKGSSVLTGPTGRQVKKQVWRELRALAAAARRIGRIDLPPVALDPGTGMEWPDGRIVFGFSTDNVENMAGFSGSQLLFVVDEASGVDQVIFEAIDGNMAGGAEDDPDAVAKLLMTSNPTRTSGYYFDSFGKNRRAWRSFKLSSEDTPNVKAGKVVTPGLATAHYIAEKRDLWGVDSDLYRVRVLGEFPQQGSNAVISLQAINAAQERHREGELPYEPQLHVGIDAARFGEDYTAIVSRRGYVVSDDIERVNGLDTVAAFRTALAYLKRHHRRGEPIPIVKVDTTGGHGSGIADMLRSYRNERNDPVCRVFDICFSAKANQPDRYPNVRSELWFAAADWLSDGGALPDDDTLSGDLTAPTYSVDDIHGRQVVEKKSAFSKRLGRSPDTGDALCLCVYQTPGMLDSEDDDLDFGEGLRFGGQRGFG